MGQRAEYGFRFADRYGTLVVKLMFGVESDVIHAEALGTHLIILNSAKAVKELFERRSSLYSDR